MRSQTFSYNTDEFLQHVCHCWEWSGARPSGVALYEITQKCREDPSLAFVHNQDVDVAAADVGQDSRTAAVDIAVAAVAHHVDDGAKRARRPVENQYETSELDLARDAEVPPTRSDEMKWKWGFGWGWNDVMTATSANHEAACVLGSPTVETRPEADGDEA